MIWIVLNEIHRGVALIGVAGYGLNCGIKEQRLGQGQEQVLLTLRVVAIVIWNT
ncbi:hypothetical protein FBBAL38_03385 [Flavobacteria bacterium BAL38]|nr:hypothetical protein FBBAL38_03385 [Flavobacteria bacterium BAL38]